MLAVAVKRSFLAVGGYAHRLSRAPFPGLATLCYHNVIADGETGLVPFRALHVTAERFRSHCRLLSRNCTPVSMAQVLSFLDGGPALPPRAVLLTFDDGYRNMLRIAAPILMEFRIPATFFVATGRPDGGLLWYDAAAAALGDENVEALKSLPPEALLARSQEWASRPSVCPAAATMTPAEVRHLAALPGMSIGAHSVTHSILAKGSTAFQRDEVAGSRGTLADWLGVAPVAFAYPNGRPELDFNGETETLVEEAGFRAAFTTVPGFAVKGCPRFRMPRFLMTDIDSSELAHRLAVSWSRT